jgi:hypothetical protein
MMRVTRVTARPGYRIEVELEGGWTGALELNSELYGPVFEPLRNEELFNQVSVDEFGVICWPNGADLAPEFVYDEVRRQAGDSMHPAA